MVFQDKKFTTKKFHTSPVTKPYRVAKKQLMKNKKLEQQLALDAQNVELLQKQIARLESALKDEQLRTEGYNTMIDIAGKEFKIEIRKKFGEPFKGKQ